MMKLLLEVALKIRRFYWWLVRPVTRGSRAIVVNPDGKVILVRHRYGDGWLLPGGKTKRDENSEETIKRELQEEIGITDISKLEFLGEYENTYEYKKDTIVVHVVKSFELKEKRHFEIESWDFFDPNILPQGTTPGTRNRIEEWLGKKPVTHKW